MIGFACPDCREPLQAAREDCPGCGRAVAWDGEVLDVRGERLESFPEERLRRLSDLEERHFWFPGRRRLIRALIRRFVPSGSRFLELGCGSGRLLASLRGLVLAGLDGHPVALRRPDLALAVGDVTRTPFASGGFDAVGAFDVVEHVDDGAFMAEVSRLLRPGGVLLVSVPAFPWLYGRFDERAGHLRRYTRAGLHRVLRAAGLAPLYTTAYQFLLFPLFVLSRLRDRGDWGLPPAWLNRLLAAVNLAEAAVAARVPLPWGSSWLCAARRG